MSPSRGGCSAPRPTETARWGHCALPMHMKTPFFLTGLLLTTSVFAAPAEWQPAKAPLMTRWAKDVNPQNVLPEYPRPQMVRSNWVNLNGLWDFAVAPKDAAKPADFARKILVPFPAESALSGVMTNITEKERLWYRRSFESAGGTMLLHFGSSDWETTVYINGKEIGTHRGGYDQFSFDISKAVKRGKNEIMVSVWDPSDGSPNSRGKQVRKPDQGIFYTASSGIWQTVWLEPVPQVHIESIKLKPDLDANALRVTVTTAGDAKGLREAVEAVALDGNTEIGRAHGEVGWEFSIPLRNVRPWSPDSPVLYDLRLSLNSAERRTRVIDSVTSYFGIRKVSLGKDQNGVSRIFLNNKPFFMLGPLDQGFWPDGLYTAPTDRALRSDIEVTKQLGFNMARKHVKVEPDRWYYWCDQLGLLVWQDMPSGDKFISPTQPGITR